MNAEKLTDQPVSNPYKFASEIAWLREAARYFSSRPTGGEDAAHWSNVYNAENANKIASRLDALPAPMEAVAWRVKLLREMVASGGETWFTKDQMLALKAATDSYEALAALTTGEEK